MFEGNVFKFNLRRKSNSDEPYDTFDTTAVSRGAARMVVLHLHMGKGYGFFEICQSSNGEILT